MEFSIRGMALELGVVLLYFLAWRFLRMEGVRARLGVKLVLFSILTYVLWITNVSPLGFAPWPYDRPRHFLAQSLCLLWWLQVAQITAATLGIFLLPPSLRKEHLVQDVFRAGVYLAAGYLAAALVLNMSLSGLIATSGALAIIFGLAVQSTLSDAFSGFVLKATRPFSTGDVIIIGDVKGNVVECDWRATTLLNDQGNVVVIPNSVAAKTSIINESRPPQVHGVSISVRVSSHARPAVVLSALNDALQGTPGLLTIPAPVAIACAMGRHFVEYKILAYVASESDKKIAMNDFIDQAHRQLIAHGVYMDGGGNLGEQHRFERLLRDVEMFRTLSNEQILELARELTAEVYEPGQIIYEAGPNCPDERRALCIVASGVAASLVPHEGQDVELRRLTPGDAVGRSGLLTGISTAIKLQAIGKVMIVRLKKEALTPVLQAHPEVAQDMLEALLEYQARVDEIIKEIPVGSATQEGLFHRLVEGMRRMHGLLSD
jgi:small-conductance mechanosensitive channel